jgi:hypothetical protein
LLLTVGTFPSVFKDTNYYKVTKLLQGQQGVPWRGPRLVHPPPLPLYCHAMTLATPGYGKPCLLSLNEVKISEEIIKKSRVRFQIYFVY